MAMRMCRTTPLSVSSDQTTPTDRSRDVSRNAVLGKAHRLGLAQNERKGGSTPRPRTPTCPPEPPTTEPPSRQDPDPVPGPASEPPTRQPQVTAAPAEVVPLRSEGVTIMELREAMCRWPLGDPTTPRSGSAERVRMSACRTARITRRSPTNLQPNASGCAPERTCNGPRHMFSACSQRR